MVEDKASLFFDVQEGRFIPKPLEQANDALPVIVFFTSDKKFLLDNEPATIRWEVRHAISVSLNNRSVGLTGSMQFHARKPEILKLKANSKHHPPVEQSLYIGVDITPPVIHYFRADKLCTVRGQSITLSWKVSGAAKVRINNGIGDVSDKSEITVQPNEDAAGIYTLVVENYFGGRCESSVSISFFPIPLIEKVFLPEPAFASELISLDKLTFHAEIELQNNIWISQPVYTNLTKLTRLESIATKIIVNKTGFESVLFPNNVFWQLIKKQKEISHLIKSIWKNRVKDLLKQSLHSGLKD
ncbi:hypothetical protein ESA94_13405 [Lacibacter luteus]|uniref:Ig-like domain-containing protein n=1 Tax=Lacibacter luteus TaxID=2508719 RepID=A0A4Q1CI36_9BACT|nr:hypothetical protein [Lacibacter luteus]RXK60038.1 hypothetical protein ESA94_13405 [Lacibacter luteus]